MSLIKHLTNSRIVKIISGGLAIAALGIFYSLVDPDLAGAEEQGFPVTNSRKPNVFSEEKNYDGFNYSLIVPRGEKRIIQDHPTKDSDFSKRFDEFISYVAGNPKNWEEAIKMFGIKYESPYGSKFKYGTYGPRESFEEKWATCDEFALLSIASLPNIESFYVVYGNKKSIFPHAISLLKQNETWGYVSNGRYVGGFESIEEAITNSNVFFKNDEYFWYELWKFNPKSLKNKGKIDLPKDATFLYSKP